jgi:ribosomal protein S18 acetylase RimI-like enzyme
MEAIRQAGPGDAAALLALQRRLDEQSSFMLLEPGERDPEPDSLRDRLAAQGPAGSFDLVAEDEQALLGWVSVEVAPFRRARRTGYLVMGVDAGAAGRGVGSALLTTAAQEGRQRGLRRLELTVMTDNLRAFRLYLRAGFQVEGLRRDALVRDGTVVSDYYKVLLLPEWIG